MNAIEFPTVTMKLRVLDGASPLTWDEARRLAHCRIVWKACKRAEEKLTEAEQLARLERARVIFWTVVLVVAILVGMGCLVFLAMTEATATVLLVGGLALLAVSVRYSNKLDGRQ